MSDHHHHSHSHPHTHPDNHPPEAGVPYNHTHKCPNPKCGHLWAHTEKSMSNIPDHTCEKCGTVELHPDKFRNDEEWLKFQAAKFGISTEQFKQRCVPLMLYALDCPEIELEALLNLARRRASS